METHREIHSLAEGQFGLITRAQLSDLAVTRAVRRRLVVRGDLVATGPQVFRVGGAPITERQAVLAACLEVGGVASHRTAAWLHHLLTGSLPSGLKGAVDEAIRLGIAHEKWLWWRLEKLRRSGRNGVRVFEQILESRAAGEVTESWLERETLQVLRAAELPLPVCQARVERKGSFVGRVDFLYAAARLVIEVSGYRWHRTADQAAADAERRRQLTLAWYSVLEYTFHEVVSSPEVLVAEVTEALGLARAA